MPQYTHETAQNYPNYAARAAALEVIYPEKRPGLVDAMKRYLKGRNLNHNVAFDEGWYPAVSRGPRIIIPATRTAGRFWQGRLMDNLVNAEQAEEFGWKRWDSPLGSRGDAVVLLGQDRGRGTLVIVEGPLDALAAAGSGCVGLATMGVQPSLDALYHVVTIGHRYKRCIIVPDRDELGGWVKIQNRLGLLGLKTEIRQPWAKDLADMEPEDRERILVA